MMIRYNGPSVRSNEGVEIESRWLDMVERQVFGSVR